MIFCNECSFLAGETTPSPEQSLDVQYARESQDSFEAKSVEQSLDAQYGKESLQSSADQNINKPQVWDELILKENPLHN